MMHWGYMPGMGAFGFGWILMILFWIIAISGIVYFIRALLRETKEVTVTERAEDIVKRRYASGELSNEEFHEKLAILEK